MVMYTKLYYKKNINYKKIPRVVAFGFINRIQDRHGENTFQIYEKNDDRVSSIFGTD